MLHEFAINQLRDLKQILENLDESIYSQPMETVFHSTVGKHCRHIIEFYQIFFAGYSTGSLAYDSRQRNSELETNKFTAIEELKKLLYNLYQKPKDKNLYIEVKIREQSYNMPSTAHRELLYLLEHTTHHLALISMGLSNIKADFTFSQSVGLAYSTPNKNV